MAAPTSIAKRLFKLANGGPSTHGWKGALVTRGVNAPLVLDGIPQPTLVARDVGEAAQAIAAGR